MSDTKPPPGCLAAILTLFGINLEGQAEAEELHREPHELIPLPYRQRDDFLSTGELVFYQALRQAVGDKAAICPKVRVADIVFVPKNSKTWQTFQNKIDRKHIDFLLCDPTTMKILFGVELDDASHQRQDRIDRDEFIDEVFAVAKIPLVRFVARSSYNVNDLAAQIVPHLSQQPATRLRVSGDTNPQCPKCNVPMIKRVAKKGDAQGQVFFGCPNYPKCREIARIS